MGFALGLNALLTAVFLLGVLCIPAFIARKRNHHDKNAVLAFCFAPVLFIILIWVIPGFILVAGSLSMFTWIGVLLWSIFGRKQDANSPASVEQAQPAPALINKANSATSDKNKKLAIAGAIILVAVAAYNYGTNQPTQIISSHSVLSVGGGNQVLVDGKPVDPAGTGDTSLRIVHTGGFSNGVANLIEIGVSNPNCPFKYRWVLLRDTGATVSPQFGNCNVLDIDPHVRSGYNNNYGDRFQVYMKNQDGTTTSFLYDGKTVEVQ